MHSYCCHQLSYPYIRQLDRLFWTFAITLPSLALADSDPQATIMTAVFGTRVPLMNYRANCHPSVKLQTPNSKLQAPNSKRQASNSKFRASNSKRQASNSKHEAVPFSASVGPGALPITTCSPLQEFLHNQSDCRILKCHMYRLLRAIALALYHCQFYTAS